MGTRSLTVIYDKKVPLVNIYCQYDGYPSGHGAELAKILKDRILVNGFNSSHQENVSNGMGCLAATIIAELKTEIGGIYIYPLQVQDADQEYEYHIDNNRVTVKDCDKELIFDGTWNKFYKFCNKK